MPDLLCICLLVRTVPSRIAMPYPAKNLCAKNVFPDRVCTVMDWLEIVTAEIDGCLQSTNSIRLY